MTTTILDAAHFIPSEKSLDACDLPDKTIELATSSAKVAGGIDAITQDTIRRHMIVINSYYSNLIEGNSTKPHEIRAAQKGNYSTDPLKRDLQLESLAHIHVNEWIQGQNLDLDRLYSVEFTKEIHKEFYEQIPESVREIKNKDGSKLDVVIPGELRNRDVDVGNHIAPEVECIETILGRFFETYHPKRFSSHKKIISVMAAHHRFLWIHPFLDGNGRVSRLFTDTALKLVGLDSYGMWCVSRGLARSNSNYKFHLANADAAQQGMLDGRGPLSEKGLMGFCGNMIETALDQVSYISDTLELTTMRKRINSYVQARIDDRVQGVSSDIKKSAGLVLYSAFLQGELSRSDAMALTGLKERSGRRLLSSLKSDGLISETSSKSPFRWEIPEHAELWYFPNLTSGI
jgi:Fic family protein